jgi:hypothetical protein
MSRAPAAAAAAATPSEGASDSIFTQPNYRRPLHWVFKVGDLQATLAFYERVFGMKARRRRRRRGARCEAAR